MLIFLNKFEAGTPHISGAIGLHAAIEYIEKIGFPALIQHEQQLTRYTHFTTSRNSWITHHWHYPRKNWRLFLHHATGSST